MDVGISGGVVVAARRYSRNSVMITARDVRGSRRLRAALVVPRERDGFASYLRMLDQFLRWCDESFGRVSFDRSYHDWFDCDLL